MNLPYQNLIDMTSALSAFVVIFIYLMLSRSRYPRKTYLKSLIPFLIFWFGINLTSIAIGGTELQGKLSLLIGTLPSLIYFWIVAKDRGGRFFFTFCLADTIMIWLMSVTGIVDIFMGNTGLYTVIFRLIIFPLFLLITWKFIRKPYHYLLESVNKGWWLFTAITALFYVSSTIMLGIPTNLRNRPEDIPATLLVLAIMPLTYLTIYRVLRQQDELHKVSERQNTLEAQTALMELRALEIQNAEDRFRIERHDLRHRLNAIEEMAQNDDASGILEYIGSAKKALDETKVKRWCLNPVLDAILSSYFQKAALYGIRVDAKLAIPEKLPVPASELSTVFANVIENMINAVKDLPEDKKYITCKCIYEPAFMLEFSNPCTDDIQFTTDGLPIRTNGDPGIGTRSIIAFAEKYDASYSFKVKDDHFTLQMAL